MRFNGSGGVLDARYGMLDRGLRWEGSGFRVQKHQTPDISAFLLNPER
jgi:hypothetical protein